MCIRFSLEELLRYNKDNIIPEEQEDESRDEKKEKESLYTLIERVQAVVDPEKELELEMRELQKVVVPPSIMLKQSDVDILEGEQKD